uniref:Coagulation factor VIIi n=1 Tax=Tetraodon nigroviridis TaxID=99883 RepID=H3CM83_TETNG
MLLRGCCTVWLLFSVAAAVPVFVERDDASAVLQRRRRANSGFLEELQQGNLERECIEEICNYEEAREVFEDNVQTKKFWESYNRIDACLAQPCQNNGVCVSMGNAYQCLCPEGFNGRHCETKVEDFLKCLYQNGQCQHFCNSSRESHKCYCAEGYKLAADGRQCVAEVEFPCGRLPPPETGPEQPVVGQTRLVGASHCPKGECPWQVLVQLHGLSHCGGVLIRPDWVFTAAHCVTGKQPQDLLVVAGEHNLDIDEGTEQKTPVATVFVHEGYVSETGDKDIALLQLNTSVSLNRGVIPVCLPTRDLAERELQMTRYHTVSGWGKRTSGGNVDPSAINTAPVSPFLRKFSVPIIPNAQCSYRSQFNFTDNMLCAGYLEGQQQSCRGDDGSPLVTLYGSTHFLIGVVGWGRGCPKPGYYGVYTNVGNFADWANGIMAEAGGKTT